MLHNEITIALQTFIAFEYYKSPLDCIGGRPERTRGAMVERYI